MLYLYQNITPNYSSTHYLFKDFSSYLTFLNDYKIKEITPKNYTINNNFIRVALDTEITASNYKNITYIINSTDEACYIVRTAKIQSGYVFFNIDVDYWGTYLHKAKLEDILIKRCNRKISDNGVYDLIDNAKDLTIERLGTSITYQGLAILFIYTTGTNQNVSNILHIGVAYLSDSGYTTMTELLYRINYCKNYKSTSGSTDFTTLSIKHAYLLPKEVLVGVDEVTSPHVFFTEGSVDIFYVREFSYSSLRYCVKELTYDTNINKKIQLGSMGGNLPEIKLTKENQSIKYAFFYNSNLFKCYVYNGDSQINITPSFELELTTKDTTDATTEISTTLRYILGVSQLGVGLIGGSPLSLVKGLGTIGRNYEEQLNRQNKLPQTNLISDGGAGMTYPSSFSENSSPYILFSSTSLKDEEKHARKLGANFNEYIDTLEEIFNYELLGTGQETDDTLIQCSINISNIPTDAITDITGKLNNGVHCQLL